MQLKRLVAGMTAALLAVILVFSFPAQGLSAQKAIVLDATTGRVLYEKNADTRSLIASTTKIMTALVVCEQCNVLDRMRIPKEAVGVEGSSIYLEEGEVLTLQELLYGMMLHSGNDAATALAIYCGGTVEGFVALMNDKARTLGLSDTHFENPHGLDSAAHYSSAKDLASLASYAMENPIFAQIVSTKEIHIEDRYLRNHNKLLWQVEGADGIKTGYTKAAGRILVSSASRDGRRLIVVTIAAPDDWNDHRLLLNQNFSNYHIEEIVSKGDILGTAEVAGGMETCVALVSDASFYFPLAAGENVEIRLPEPGFVYAPVASGQPAGEAKIYLNNYLVGKVSLIYGDTIEQEPQQELKLWKRLLGGINHDR